MSLRFPYQNVPIVGPAPPTLPINAVHRPRPLVPVRIVGRSGFRDYPQSLLDTGAVDTVFPDHLVNVIDVDIVPSAVNQLRWRGQAYPMRFGRVTLQLTDGISLWTWQAIVAFSTAPLSVPLLGHTGCMEFMTSQFVGDIPEVLLEVNARFGGMCE